MKRIFVDTFFYLAILNPKDRAHHRAMQVAASLDAQFFTTQWVLGEVGDAFCAPYERSRFLAFHHRLESNPDLEILAASAGQYASGLQLFERRPDKDWGLTDCISFAVMHEFGLTDALTGDQHFTQAGFRALLLD